MTDEPAVFGPVYATRYDVLYEAKDYPAECDAIETLMARFGARPVRDILDLGCGTGTHALILASRGHAVTGVDRSPAMLALAREKAAQNPAAGVTFLEGDIRTVRVGRSFDAVVMLFAVLGYQTSDDDVIAALRTAVAHLRPGGAFVCDVWYGPAVVATGTSERLKVIDGPAGRLHRASSGTLDPATHRCSVRITTWRDVNGRRVDESTEDHMMRYFFEPELARFFRDAGLECFTMRAFDDPGAAPGAATWSAWVAGRVPAA